MVDNNQLPYELDFITRPSGVSLKLFRRADWLYSEFGDPVWIVRIAQNRKRDTAINFRIKLDDGLLLTHPKHQSLLESIKSYLCLSSHPLTAGGIELAPRTIEQRVYTAIGVIDYFLLRSKRFQLASHGFKLITPSEIIEFISILAAGQYLKSNLYAVREELKNFLLLKISTVTEEESQRVISKVPYITIINGADGKNLGLTESQIIAARIYLWLNGSYKYVPLKASKGMSSFFTYRISSCKIYSEIYSERALVIPHFRDSILDELHFGPSETVFREYPMVSSMLMIDDPLPSETGIDMYRQALKRMELLKLCELDHINHYALLALDNKAFLKQLDMKNTGRFRSLPQNVIFLSFRRAVEFYFDIGKIIIDGYLALSEEISSRGCTISDLSPSEFTRIIPNKLSTIGVKTWDLSADFCRMDQGCRSAIFFKRFRANEGLFQLIEVLYASIWIILSAISARRSGEIRELETNSCLVQKNHGYYLQFKLRKRNFGKTRELVLRPIPNIAAQCIQTLIDLHKKLSLLSTVEVTGRLFSKPRCHKIGLSDMSSADTANVLDRFSDYFETPMNSDGQRYYIRTHQMRRFFAMAFFWASGFGGLDTLRWYLGHTDIEHVYHYITETVPGEVLRRVSAEFASENLISGQSNTLNLKKLLKERYGLSSFSIMQSDEVSDYIEGLMIEGDLKIEPIFIDTPKGKRYEILFKITGEIYE